MVGSVAAIADTDTVFVTVCSEACAYFQFVFIRKTAFYKVIGQGGVHVRNIGNVNSYTIDRKIVFCELIGKIGEIRNFAERAVGGKEELHDWALHQLEAQKRPREKHITHDTSCYQNKTCNSGNNAYSFHEVCYSMGCYKNRLWVVY